MDAKFSQILSQFQLIGTPVSCERYGFGHINETYLVVTDQSLRYILQKINNHVFPHVDQLQQGNKGNFQNGRQGRGQADDARHGQGNGTQKPETLLKAAAEAKTVSKNRVGTA